MAEPAKKKKVFPEQNVISPKFRVAFPHIDEPSAIPNTDNAPKYSLTMLISKKTNIKKLREAIRLATISQFGKKEKWPDNLMDPIKDGDSPEFKDYDGFKGMYAIRVSSKDQPEVLDADGDAIEDIKKHLYAGCYARADLFAGAYDKGKNKGVALYVQGIQKLDDGDRFDGRKSSASKFAAAAMEDDDDTGRLDDESDEVSIDEDDDGGF